MKKAFTLIEMVIVACVIAVLAAIAVPNYKAIQGAFLVEKISQDLILFLNDSSVSAVESGDVYKLAYDSSYRSLVLYNDANNETLKDFKQKQYQETDILIDLDEDIYFMPDGKVIYKDDEEIPELEIKINRKKVTITKKGLCGEFYAQKEN